MIPDYKDIVCSLAENSAALIEASRQGDANVFYRTLSNIERLAAYNKTKMDTKMVIDPNEAEDDDL